jgi:Na+/H+ antiporter NhaD/arsenite permease-like protein
MIITLLSIIFVLGYLLITLEHPLRLHKTVSALLTATLCWAVYAVMDPNRQLISEQLIEHFAAAAAIAVFLIGAMTIVEIIDAHGGFSIVTDRIGTRNQRKLLWLIGGITFFLSPILDNLTTTIVMVSLTRKLIKQHKDRLFFTGIIVIAANAGGAWSPLGDVTTTMLWIGGQISALKVVKDVFLASTVNLLIPLVVVSIWIKTEAKGKNPERTGRGKTMEDIKATITDTKSSPHPVSHFEQRLVFGVGVGALLFVPIFKTITHLPPWMGMLFGLSILWGITEILHRNKREDKAGQLGVTQALRRIDTPSILFFIGILLAVGALQAIGLLGTIAGWLDREVGNLTIIVMVLGLLSAIVDNVPLVAATMGMYNLTVYPMDHFFWQFIAYCSGTGGSILVIGSAAGVAAMGLEKITFGWYLKKIAPLALVGYLTGVGVFVLQRLILG